jgi:DNA-binding response OmpR family regulator
MTALLVETADLDQVPIARLVQAAEGGVLVIVADQADPKARTRALRAGADACFTRPVHFMELEARLSALVRLAPGAAADSPFVLDPATRTARFADRDVVLPASEFRLLDYMARHTGEVSAPPRSWNRCGARPAIPSPNWCAPRWPGCAPGWSTPSASRSWSPCAGTAIGSTPT